MKEPTLIRMWLSASIASLFAAPVGVLLVQSMSDALRPFETFGGALVATLFFGVTPAVAMLKGDGPGLKDALVMAYAAKVSLLLAVGLALTSVDMDEMAFGLSIVVSGFVYILVQTVVFNRLQR